MCAIALVVHVDRPKDGYRLSQSVSFTDNETHRLARILLARYLDFSVIVEDSFKPK